jgi:hypothetical protein
MIRITSGVDSVDADSNYGRGREEYAQVLRAFFSRIQVGKQSKMLGEWALMSW